MIGLVFAQLAARWGQAVTLLLLSTAATVAAVSGPVFAVAVERSVLAQEVAAADNAELVVSLPPLQAGDATGNGSGGPPDELDAYLEARRILRGFVPITTSTIQVEGMPGPEDPDSPDSPDSPDGPDGPDGPDSAVASEPSRLLARDGFCAFVTFREGRCPVGSREAALPVELAERLGSAAGDQVVLTPIRRAQDEWEVDGPPATITLVGVFAADDPGEPYWSPQDPLGLHGLAPAVLTNPATLGTMPHGQEQVFVDAMVPVDRLTPEGIGGIRRQLDRVTDELGRADPLGGRPTTRLPDLLDRIEGHGDQARALLPIAAAPLVGLCWLVVHLVVGRAVAGRLQEVGVVAVRGARWRTRAFVVAAEHLLPILAGVPFGLLLAHVLVTVAGPGSSSTGSAGIPVDRTQLLALAIAAGGAIVAATLAVRRELAAPVAHLLRRVPPRGRGVAAFTVPVLAVALGAVVTADLRLSDGDLTGLMVVAPAVIMLAVVVLAAPLVEPGFELIGRWALRRGSLGPAIATLQLARRTGGASLLVVLALLFGSVGFAVAGTEVAGQGRAAEAGRTLGADRVVDVAEADRSRLLHAVRSADPDGAHAMAVATVPAFGDDPPALAVDAERLAAVALWSERYGGSDGPGGPGGVGPDEVAALVRPAAPEPVRIDDGELVAELSPGPLTPDDTLTLALRLAPLVGGDLRTVRFGPVTSEESTYAVPVTGCEEGCRLAGVTVAMSDTNDAEPGITLHRLTQEGRAVLTDEATEPAWWRAPDDDTTPGVLRVEPADPSEQSGQSGRPGQTGAVGLTFERGYSQPRVEYVVSTGDVPYPLPAVGAGSPLGEPLVDVDDQPVRIDLRADLVGLPGVDRGAGTLVDLEYAERLAVATTAPRVWLSADAPASIVERLGDHGLEIVGERSLSDLVAAGDRSGAAMALRYHQIAAGAAIVVGLGALLLVIGIDRPSNGQTVRHLRAQGVPARTTVASAIWSYGGMVLAGAVIGVVAAAVAWLVAGERLPVGVDETMLAARPSSAPVATALVVCAALVAAAVAGAWWQHMTTRTRESR